MKIKFVIASLLVFSLIGCSNEDKTDSDGKKETQSVMFEELSIKADTLVSIAHSEVDRDIQIRVPEGDQFGTILVLQGWNFPITDWCDSTELCEKALEQGFVLVFPDMGKSIYAESHYPETRKDWDKEPTRKWLRETVITHLQKEFGLFKENGNNFVMGLSTGGRGALFMALEMPKVFDAAATLSGDYDQFMFPNDNLYRGYFGPHKEFQERWKGSENPAKFVGGLQIPLYVGHGLKDGIVPHRHMELLQEHFNYYNIENMVEFHTDSSAGHSYSYWNSEVDNVIEFFKNPN